MILDLVKIRRDLHQIPEIGLEEFKTQAYLLERIAEITEGKGFVEQRTWRTGILVFLKGSNPEKTRIPVRQVRCSTNSFPSVISAMRSKR